MVILTAVCALMLHLFYGYHFYLIWCGTTTNESMKLGQLEYMLAKAEKFFAAWHEG